MTQEEEILQQVASLPALSPGLRTRVLAAALEAQESRRHSRRLIAGSLSLFGLLSWFSWRGPASRAPGSSATAVARDGLRSSLGISNLVPMALASPAVNDDFSVVEVELRSRQDYFPRVQQM